MRVSNTTLVIPHTLITENSSLEAIRGIIPRTKTSIPKSTRKLYLKNLTGVQCLMNYFSVFGLILRPYGFSKILRG